MHQAKILWDRADYRELEYLFARTLDHCRDNDTWKLNVAHMLYMQEDKYDEAARFYEPIVNSKYDTVRPSDIILILSLILIDGCFLISVIRGTFKK